MSVIFNNAKVIISTSTADGTNDISASVTKVTLERKYDLHENTHMGQSAKSRIAGLEEWSMTIDVLQSFSTGDASVESQINIDKLLSTLIDINTTGKSFMVHVRPKNTARSSDNPEYKGLVVLESYSPMDGEVGDLLKMTIPLQSADNLTRSVSTS